MKNKNYITMVTLIFIVLVGVISFTIRINRAEKELEATNVKLQLKEDELLYTQEELFTVQNELSTTKNELIFVEKELTTMAENLQIETEKSAGLSEKLGVVMGELDALNNTLNVVKSEAYNVAYLGEFRYTYYCDERYPHICGGGIGLTASGAATEVGTTIAVDPNVIPLGSTVYIEGIGLRVAQDTGGAIKGNKIDILLPTHNECFEQTLINGSVWIVSQKTP